MPALARPPNPESIELAPRTATVAANADVLVVGGGPAGIGAAIGAASAGANVVLAERYGFLGGNATAALVMPWMSFYTEHPQREVFGALSMLPTDHGPGEPVLAGLVRRFIARLVELGGAIQPSLETGFTTPFDAELFKQVAMEMVDKAGVRFLFHAFASDVVTENGEVRGAVFETKSGPVVVRARTTVDCTGDGDVAVLAGAPYEVGRESDGLVQPMTLMFRIGEFERAAFEGYVKQHPDQWRGVHGLWNLIKEATAAGELDLPREDILLFATLRERELVANCTRVTRPDRVLGTDVWDLTYAEWISRRQMRQIALFLRRYVPGFEKAHVLQSGMHVGVRETRRIIGEYRLVEKDVLSARKFPDVIARNTYPIDVHNPQGTGTYFRRLPPGESYDIPLRCLIPKGVNGLLVAGRCISGSHEAHSSYRVMPVSMAVGQAAGVTAALAAARRRVAREVAVSDIQRELLRQGANLGHKGAPPA